jgi:diguanylate cyclase (GGDEF)-like protein
VLVALAPGVREHACEELIRRGFYAETVLPEQLSELTRELGASCILIDFDAAIDALPYRLFNRAKDPVPMLVFASDVTVAAPIAQTDPQYVDVVARPCDWDDVALRVTRLLETCAGWNALQRAQRVAHMGSWKWDPESDEMQWSDETFRVLGLEPGSFIPSGQTLLSRVHNEDRPLLQEHLRLAVKSGKAFSLEHRVTLPDGNTVRVRHEGESCGLDGFLVGTIQDITSQVESIQSIQQLANVDSLTGLANRRFFLERLDQAINDARRTGQLGALLYLDLDQFKRINDSLGHRAGDVLLRTVADRIIRQVREHDDVGRLNQFEGGYHSISRLGGDEFTVFLPNVTRRSDVEQIAKRLLHALGRPIEIDHREVLVTVSIGVAMFPSHAEDAETLLQHADSAMYFAKDRGRNNYQFYDDSMGTEALRSLLLESNLRRALPEGALSVAYQPRIRVRDGTVCGAEALMRWNDRELGRIAASEFIPVAEESGLIVPLGSWIFETVCEEKRRLNNDGAPPIPLSVNVSPAQFVRDDVEAMVTHGLRHHGIEPSQIEIEITESLLMQQDQSVSMALHTLRAIGVRIALDDFGTGYSSLSYLTQFPIDTLKIDRCLVRDVHSDPNSQGILRALIEMGHSLGMVVVAEGVDCVEQYEILKRLGCDEAQGFLFSQAVPIDDFRHLLHHCFDD